MGQLRTGIENLMKKINKIVPDSKGLDDIAGESADKLRDAAKPLIEGYDLLYLSLTSKLKSKGEKIDDRQNDKISEIGDPNAKSMIKGIKDWNASVKKLVAQAQADFAKTAEKVEKTVKDAQSEAASLTKIAEKKKSKLLKSKKYKDKIKTYLGYIADASKMLDDALSAVTAAGDITLKDSWVDKNFPVVDENWTIKMLKAKTSMDLNTQLTNYKTDAARYDNHVRKFRDELKTIPNQLKSLKKFSEEAEEMEDEATE